MALSQERTYTIDDIYALPEGQRAELIDGHGREKKATTSGEGGRDLGGKVDGVGGEG